MPTSRRGGSGFQLHRQERLHQGRPSPLRETSKETLIYLNTDSDKAAEGVIKLKGAFDMQKGWFVL